MTPRIPHPQLAPSAQAGKRPRLLFVGDPLGPTDILAQGGLLSRGLNYASFIDHLLGRVTEEHQSGWIGATAHKEVAQAQATSPHIVRPEAAAWHGDVFTGWAMRPRLVSEGWVYEVEPAGNFVSLTEAAANRHQRAVASRAGRTPGPGSDQEQLARATCEWAAVRKIPVQNIVRATKFRRMFPTGQGGMVTSFPQLFEHTDEWHNPDHRPGHPGYDPYDDPASQWTDRTELHGFLDRHPERGAAEAEARACAQPRVCVHTPLRGNRAVAHRPGCVLVEWDRVRQRAKNAAATVLADRAFLEGIPARQHSGLDAQATAAVVEHLHHRLASSRRARTPADRTAVAIWAAELSRNFADQDVTTLAHIGAAISVVSGIGAALGLVRTPQRRDAEIVTSDVVALAALAAAQAAPYTGELQDTALLTAQLVDALTDLFPHFIRGRSAHLPVGAVANLPDVNAWITCGTWSTSMDIEWADPGVRLPPRTEVVIRERGGCEWAYPLSDGKSPGWFPPLSSVGSSRTFDMYLRLKREWATYTSERRTVVRVAKGSLHCAVSVRQEPW